MRDLALFVNTSDGFSDCWEPFFTLLDRFGGALNKLPIYLNTERSQYSRTGLDIVSTRVWPDEEMVRPTWSECLLRGLGRVREPFVFYVQEDYFLTAAVRDDIVASAVELLRKNPALPVVYLNRFGPQFRRQRPFAEGFVEIVKPASYLLSTQAAIWRTCCLRELTASWENGWMFEKFGSIRAARSSKKFLSVDPETMLSAPVVDYVYTGVIKGQWKEECVDLFKRSGIAVDFSKRGFYKERGRLKSRIEVLRKLFGNPRNALRSLGTLW